QSIEVRVPDLGNFTEVAVIEVLVKAGDRIEVDTPLVTLETEKATMDVPSSAAGVVEKVHVEAGGKVSEGSVVVTLRAEGAGAADKPAEAAPAAAPAAAGGGAKAAAAPQPAPAPASVDVAVPDMGNFTEVGVSEVLVKKGDKVEVDTPLVTLESEKATMDVPSTAAGTVEAVHVQKGGTVAAGSRVVTLVGVVAAPAAAAAAPASAPAATSAAPKSAPAA